MNKISFFVHNNKHYLLYFIKLIIKIKKSMKNVSLFSPKSRFNNVDFFWNIIERGFVILQNFETYGEYNSPQKFKIILSNETIKKEILVDLNFDSEGKTYQDHNLNISFDSSLFKIEVVPLPNDDDLNRVYISYKLNYKFSDEDRDSHIEISKPVVSNGFLLK